MDKKRSKIVKDLIMDKINVLQAMQSLDFIIEDLNDENIKKWVNSELKGYQSEDELPDYRKTIAMLKGNIQVGCHVYNNVDIPIADQEIFEKITKIELREPISTIIQMAKAENEVKEHSLSLSVNTVMVNHYQQTNGDVIRAHRMLGVYTYNNIIAKIKDKLLEIFKLLENNYGNLDELYIDFSDESKREETEQSITNIIYNDNSIKIGNNNKIDKSIVGDENGN